jgi:hypothetical protein
MLNLSFSYQADMVIEFAEFKQGLTSSRILESLPRYLANKESVTASLFGARFSMKAVDLGCYRAEP